MGKFSQHLKNRCYWNNSSLYKKWKELIEPDEHRLLDSVATAVSAVNQVVRR